MTKKTWIGSVEREKDEKERKIFEKVKNTWGEKAFFFFFIPFEIRSFEYQSGTNRTNRDQSLKNKGFSID